MKKLLYILLLLSPTATFAGNVDSLLMRIMECSPSAIRAKADMEAAKAANHVGQTLADPSVGFNYLWGSPQDVGQRKDISITQSLDYATLSGRKRKEAEAKDVMADMEYNLSALSLHQMAVLLLIDIAAANELRELNNQRLAQSERLAESYRKKMAAGEASKLDVNKAALSLATIQSDALDAEAQRQELLCSPLIVTALTDADRHILEQITTADVYATLDNISGMGTMNDAENAVARQQVAVAQAELGTARSANMPELTAGYMAELTRDEKFRGVTLGVNIPLWSNRRNVAHAKAQLSAAQAAQAEREAEAMAQHRQAQQRLSSAKAMRLSLANSIKATSSMELLDKALREGSISIIDYLTEQNEYFSLKERYIEATRKHLMASLFATNRFVIGSE